jgi:hypothetical protein
MATNCSHVALFSVMLTVGSIAAEAQSTAPPEPGRLANSGQTQSQQSPQASTEKPGGLEDLRKTVSAPAFTVRDKFDYRVVQSFGARGLVGALFGAAIGQADNSPHEWGQGVHGFAERYGSGLAGNLSRQTFAFVLESSFREDPRYFPSEDRTKKYRALNAAKQVIICKRDSGRSEFAYGRVFSNFGAAQFDNIWQPRSTGSVADGFKRGVIGLGADFAYNLMQEFIPFTRPISLRHRH